MSLAEISESYDQVSSLWLANGLPPDALSHLKLSSRPDAAINSSFKLGSAAQVSNLKHLNTEHILNTPY